MSRITVEVNFEGGFAESQFNQLPIYSGIYIVYSGIYNPPPPESFVYHDLLYIGEAENIKERFDKHKEVDELKLQLRNPQMVLVSARGCGQAVPAYRSGRRVPGQFNHHLLL